MENLADRAKVLDDLFAEREILATMCRYAAALDNAQVDDYVDVFTEDGVFEVLNSGRGAAPRRMQGRSALREYQMGKPAPRPGTFIKHMNVNPRIQVQGDTATGVSYWLTLSTTAEGSPYVPSFGRYLDTFVKGGRCLANQGTSMPQRGCSARLEDIASRRAEVHHLQARCRWRRVSSSRTANYPSTESNQELALSRVTLARAGALRPPD